MYTSFGACQKAIRFISTSVQSLKEDGYLILTAPQAWPLHEEPYDFFRYTKYGLAELAESNNLKVVKLEEHGGGITAIGQLTAAVLYDTFGKRQLTRVPMKSSMPGFSDAEFLDNILTIIRNSVLRY